jgi:uncharacterized membrane protein
LPGMRTREEACVLPRLTVALGSALVLVGLGGYVGGRAASLTALIPAIIGLLFVLLGIFALKAAAGDGQPRRAGWFNALNIALVLAILAFLGTSRGLMRLPALIAGAEERPLAVGSQSLTAAMCLAYIVAWVLFKTRKAPPRETTPPESPSEPPSA